MTFENYCDSHAMPHAEFYDIPEITAARAAWYAATLAERERCAALVDALTARRRWIRMACNSQKTIEPCELAAAIREGVKP